MIAARGRPINRRRHHIRSACRDLDDATAIETLTPPSRLRKGLWLGGAALVVFLLTLIVGNFALPREKRLTSAMVGHDFLAFYTAGQVLSQPPALGRFT